jgi:hypothetical protein
LSLVARKNELMIWGPAIMTNASGRISAMLIRRILDGISRAFIHQMR